MKINDVLNHLTSVFPGESASLIERRLRVLIPRFGAVKMTRSGKTSPFVFHRECAKDAAFAVYLTLLGFTLDAAFDLAIKRRNREGNWTGQPINISLEQGAADLRINTAWIFATLKDDETRDA